MGFFSPNRTVKLIHNFSRDFPVPPLAVNCNILCPNTNTPYRKTDTPVFHPIWENCVHTQEIKQDSLVLAPLVQQHMNRLAYAASWLFTNT